MKLTRLLPLIFCLAGLALSQTDEGRIVGAVTDIDGAMIPAAKVLVKNQRTGIERSVTSNEQGRFVITNLSPAQYAVSSNAPGLGTTEVQVVVSAGQERTVNLSLQPAVLQQQITVSGGDLVVVDTSSARIGANVNERDVASMPLNGRQLSSLYLMAPGAVTSGGGSFDNIRFSGRANQQNAVRFDGIEGSSIIDASPGNLSGESSTGFRLQASLETVQEFRVESSNYPAEYGTGTAGQISIVTKSGSNTLHGSVFDYVRNDDLDARNFFDWKKAVGPTKSPLRLNQFGASLGGPILKDKLFLFGSFETVRQRNGVNITELVPNDAARAKAVSSIRPLLDAYPKGQYATADPNLDAVSVSAANSMDEYYGNVRLDYTISPKYQLTARYMRDQGYLRQPVDVTNNFWQTTAVPQNAMVSLQQILKPTMINETKIGFNGQKTRINGVAPIINGINTSEIYVSFSGQAFIPGIGGQGASAGTAAIGGLVRSNSAQNGRAQPYTGRSLSFLDNLSWLKGNHSIRFGAEIRPVRLYTDRLGAATYTYSGITALLNNTPDSVAIVGDASGVNPFHPGQTGNRQLDQTYLVFYGQDEWKLRPNLTLNYGLRYEYYSVMHEANNLYELFQVERGGLAPSGTPWYKSSKLNFGPRLALSWAPEKLNNKTVFRIGAGYYFGPGQTEDQVQPIDSDRVSTTLKNTPFPVDWRSIVASYNVNNLQGYQPRAYAMGYTLPEKVLSYTFSIQQQLPGGSVLTAAYVGSQGRNLFLRSWTNRTLGVTMNADGTAKRITEFDSRFSDSGIDYKTSGGTDHYDSLQTSIQHRFSRGLTVGGQWTYGHSMGNTGGSNEAQTTVDPTNFNLDRGNNLFDIRHSANFNALYELPFGRGRKFGANSSRIADVLAGGWDLGGVFNVRTGIPVDITIDRPDILYYVSGTGLYYTGVQKDAGGNIISVPVLNNPFGGAFRSNRRPSVVAGVDPFLHGSDGRYYLNPAAFTIPQPGQFGNLGRFPLHGPGMSQLDFTLHKRITISEKVNMEFRGEFYNILNRTNFAAPPARLANALGTGTNKLQPGQPYTLAAAGGAFGISTATVDKGVGLGTNRQLQLSLRLNF
jgi:hypothetical protein